VVRRPHPWDGCRRWSIIMVVVGSLIRIIGNHVPSSSPQEGAASASVSLVLLSAAGLMMTAANAPHLENAYAPMVVVEVEIVTHAKELHL
jgi:hypothetical protein